MESSDLFVSSCSRRDLARRRAAGRFWTRRNIVWLLRRVVSAGRH
ncbi:MAG: hypothetical protein ACRDKL_06500 [Solirubrobacteraceae bacterium]